MVKRDQWSVVWAKARLSAMSVTDIHLTNAQIVLDPNKAKYQLGEYIHGKLLISLNGRLQLSWVKIGLTCVATIKAVDSSAMYQREGKVCLAKSDFKHVLLNHTYELPQQGSLVFLFYLVLLASLF